MRAEDVDLEIGMIFNSQNEMYRQKFVPNIEREIDRQKEIEAGFLKAKIENKNRKEALLRQFNNKYKGEYEELEVKVEELHPKPLKHFSNADRNNKIEAVETEREQLIELNYKNKKDKLTNLNHKISSNQMLPELKEKNSVSMANFRNARKGRQTSLVRRTFGNEVSLPRLNKNQRPQGILKQPSFNIIDAAEDKGKNDEDEEGDGFLISCPKGCGRKFGKENLDRHVQICQKVFTGKREIFNIAKYRMARNYKR